MISKLFSNYSIRNVQKNSDPEQTSCITLVRKRGRNKNHVALTSQSLRKQNTEMFVYYLLGRLAEKVERWMKERTRNPTDERASDRIFAVSITFFSFL